VPGALGNRLRGRSGVGRWLERAAFEQVEPNIEDAARTREAAEGA
jgi:hypothetical protein